MHDLEWVRGLDSLLDKYGIKYIFVETGDYAIKDKIDEVGMPVDKINPNWKFWIELSWGSVDDEFDFAYNSFGTTFSEAFMGCIELFRKWASVHGTQAKAFVQKYKPELNK